MPKFYKILIFRENRVGSLCLRIGPGFFRLLKGYQVFKYAGLVLLLTSLLFAYSVQKKNPKTVPLSHDFRKKTEELARLQSQVKFLQQESDPYLKSLNAKIFFPENENLLSNITLEKDILLNSTMLSFESRRSAEQYKQLTRQMEKTLMNLRYIPSVQPAEGEFTSGFGYRIHPVTGAYQIHEGIDIKNHRGTPIIAPADGVVKEVTVGGFFGLLVVLDHGNGYKTKFGHLSGSSVREGQHVQRFQNIASMGATGRTTGDHLHYEVHYQNQPINPSGFIIPRGYAVD